MACCRHRWTVLAILFVIAGSAVVAEDTEGPVPLYTPRPRTPIEAAGADVVPELKVRVEIDARGRVTEVVVLGIQPSTSLDEHFKREATDTLMRWRYYPASSDGQPTSTHLEWKLKFPSREAAQEEEAGPQEVAPTWHLLDRGEDSSDRYRRFVLSLPVTDRLDMLKGFVAIAEGFLTSDSIKEYATGRVIALTDAPSDDVARILAANIESLFNILEQMLKAKVEAQPEPNKIVAVIYASEPSYKRLVRSVRANENWAGFYNPAGLLVFHMNQPSNETLTGLLLHEATHAYIDRYVVRPGVSPPRWLNEGFAEYIGNSTIRKKQLVPGKKRTTEVYRNSWFVQTGRSHTLVTAKTVRNAIRSGEAMTLEEIITAGPKEFYGERMSMFYAMSWLLVHFLRHGEAGWAENEFPSLMLYVAEGYPAQEALRQFYGELEDLEPRFHDYVKSF